MKKFILVSLLGAATINSYAVDYPGTSANCTSGDSLQTCISNQPDGGYINVVTNDLVVVGTIFISSGLTLTAGVGYHPIFEDTTVTIEVPADKTVTLRGFEFQKAVLVDATVTSGSTINIMNNNWTNPNVATSQEEGIRVTSNATTGNTATINIRGNNIIGENNDTAYGLVDVYNNGLGLLKANIYDNHLTINDTNAGLREGIYLFNGSAAGLMQAQIVANEIRGSASKIKLVQSVATNSMNIGVVSNLLTGVIDKNTVIDASSDNRGIFSQIAAGNFKGTIGNNTIDGKVGNGGSAGIGFDFSSHTTPVSGGNNSLLILNNIVVNTTKGYDGPATGGLTSVTSTGNNLFFNHGTITGLTLVASDVNAPPEFIEEGVNYGLKETSIAIDKSSTFATSLAYAVSYLSGYPQIDADGLRRYKGPATDVGAYEWGDRHIFTQAVNPTSQIIPINDSILDADANAFPLTTQMWNYPFISSTAAYNDHPIGVYRSGGKWRIFNEDVVVMPNNAKFHVFHPYGEEADGANNLQVYTNPAGVTDSGFDMSNIPSDSSKIVIAKNYWTGVYNTASLEVGYGNDNKWYVRNVDGSDMPDNAKVMTYYQDESRNAFRHIVNADNTSAHITTIDHPLLNNNPCVIPTVTQATSWFFGPLFGQNPNNIGVYYSTSSSRWKIFNQDLVSILTGLGAPVFNVLVDPQQVYTCNDIIFKHGFE